MEVHTNIYYCNLLLLMIYKYIFCTKSYPYTYIQYHQHPKKLYYYMYNCGYVIYTVNIIYFAYENFQTIFYQLKSLKRPRHSNLITQQQFQKKTYLRGCFPLPIYLVIFFCYLSKPEFFLKMGHWISYDVNREKCNHILYYTLYTFIEYIVQYKMCERVLITILKYVY